MWNRVGVRTAALNQQALLACRAMTTCSLTRARARIRTHGPGGAGPAAQNTAGVFMQQATAQRQLCSSTKAQSTKARPIKGQSQNHARDDSRVRCVSCGSEKTPASFSKSQLKKPRGAPRKCMLCAAVNPDGSPSRIGHHHDRHDGSSTAPPAMSDGSYAEWTLCGQPAPAHYAQMLRRLDSGTRKDVHDAWQLMGSLVSKSTCR